MSTPDKTMDDVSKLVAEAREKPRSMGYGTLLPALADALESVAKELREAKRDDEEHYQRSLSWKARRDRRKSRQLRSTLSPVAPPEIRCAVGRHSHRL